MLRIDNRAGRRAQDPEEIYKAWVDSFVAAAAAMGMPDDVPGPQAECVTTPFSVLQLRSTRGRAVSCGSASMTWAGASSAPIRVPILK